MIITSSVYKPSNSFSARKWEKGLTLLEVIVAVSIMAIIAVVSYQALSVVTDSSEISQEKLERLKRIDRTWIIIENDIRHILASAKKPQFGEAIPALKVDRTAQDYWLMLLRGGVANPLGLPRTEIKRVAYKLEENVIYRYSWIDPYNLDEANARPQKLLDGVDEILVRLLMPNAKSISSGPWEDSWPAQRGSDPAALPMAIEITLTLKDAGDLRRFMSIVKGDSSSQGAGTGGDDDGTDEGGADSG